MFKLDYPSDLVPDLTLISLFTFSQVRASLDETRARWCEENLGYVPKIEVERSIKEIEGHEYDTMVFSIDFETEEQAMHFKLSCL